MKKDDISKWPIPAFTLIGLGLGILITFLVSRKKNKIQN